MHYNVLHYHVLHYTSLIWPPLYRPPMYFTGLYLYLYARPNIQHVLISFCTYNYTNNNKHDQDNNLISDIKVHTKSGSNLQ